MNTATLVKPLTIKQIQAVLEEAMSRKDGLVLILGQKVTTTEERPLPNIEVKLSELRDENAIKLTRDGHVVIYGKGEGHNQSSAFKASCSDGQKTCFSDWLQKAKQAQKDGRDDYGNPSCNMTQIQDSGSKLLE